jgi:hypothetical protein
MFVASMTSASQAIGGFSTLPQNFVAIAMRRRLYSDACSSQEGVHLFFLPRICNSLRQTCVSIATNIHGKKLNIRYGIPSFRCMFVGILTIVCRNYDDMNKKI